jgi:hypothetical protein
MALLDPVTPFLSLIDRLISLIKEPEIKRREYFEKIIDPLYTQFKPLGEDYLVLFREARKAVDSAKRKRDVIAAAADISRRRDQFAASRAQLNALLSVCQKSMKKKDQDLADFLFAMQAFFFLEVRLGGGLSSLGKHLVELFSYWEQQQRPSKSGLVPHSAAIKGILSVSARLERSWFEIAGRYMELKLKYVIGEKDERRRTPKSS